MHPWPLRSIRDFLFLLAAMKLGQGNIFTSMCEEFCPHGGRVSASVHAGIHTPTPWEQTPPRQQTPPWEQTPQEQTPPPPLDLADPPGPGNTPREADSSIRSTSGRYASYWNAFLCKQNFVCILSRKRRIAFSPSNRFFFINAHYLWVSNQ